MTSEDVILFESGELINDGDHFIAKVDSIEGHRRVTLVIQKDELEESQTPVYCGLNHSHSKDCLQ